jgi:hypothetical protein
MYSLMLNNVETDANATDVVSGTIPLFDSVASILFDSGATHSFISSAYVKLCHLNTKPLEENICVATPVGDSVTCRKYVDELSNYHRREEVTGKASNFQYVGLRCHSGNGLAIEV